MALPFYLEHGLGRGAAATGLLMTPWPLTVALAAPLSGRLADRLPTGLLCGVGGGLLCAGLCLMAAWPLGADLRPLVALAVLSGLGFGLFQTPSNRDMLPSAPVARSGAAGGLQATAAPRLGLAAGAVLALAGGLVSLRRVSL